MSQQASQVAQAAEARRREGIAKIETIFTTPITFYGRVIDQNGDSVSGARADFAIADKFYDSGSRYQRLSDAEGYFSISGIEGAVLTVVVTKEGYYYIHGKSNGSFGYGIGPDSTRKEPPTKDNPSVFVLQKMGVAEPLMLDSLATNMPVCQLASMRGVQGIETSWFSKAISILSQVAEIWSSIQRIP